MTNKFIKARSVTGRCRETDIYKTSQGEILKRRCGKRHDHDGLCDFDLPINGDSNAAKKH